MKLSSNGLEFLKHMEGVKLTSYQDSVGIWTIFVGLIQVNNKPVVKGQTITMEEGNRELMKQLATYEICVNNAVKVNLTQNAYDALVSLCFNIGCGAFKTSTLLKKLNLGDDVEVEWLKWCKAGGKTVAGLLARRNKEYALFKS